MKYMFLLDLTQLEQVLDNTQKDALYDYLPHCCFRSRYGRLVPLEDQTWTANFSIGTVQFSIPNLANLAKVFSVEIGEDYRVILRKKTEEDSYESTSNY